MMNSAKLGFVVVAIAAIVGCAGARNFQGSDVAEPSDLKWAAASGVQFDGQQVLQTGKIEYDGKADLVDAFKLYMEHMKANGWKVGKQDFAGNSATATLYKDTRNCLVEFKGEGGTVHASVTVTSK